MSRSSGEPDATSFTLLGRSNSAPTETLVPTDSTDTLFRRLALDQFAVQPVMIPLAMIVGDEFRDRSSMMAFAKRNQAVQTFLFDRADEPFGVGLGIPELAWFSVRRPHAKVLAVEEQANPDVRLRSRFSGISSPTRNASLAKSMYV